jgi:superoxide dismutase, Fe-Mn family
MTQYEARQFNIPELQGISAKTVEEHLKLYAGYVSNTNAILKLLEEERTAEQAHNYAHKEARRRLGFEFDGMRNQEYYFGVFEHGAQELDSHSALAQQIVAQWGSFDAWKKEFADLAKTRGVGWAMLYLDPASGDLIMAWVDEQHVGHLTGLPVVLALDMWEHSFVADYQPSGKGQYIDDFFANVNWHTVATWFEDAKTVPLPATTAAA